MYRLALTAMMLSFSACAYETRIEPSGAFAPAMTAAQAEAECKARQIEATAGMQNWGAIVATAEAVRDACMEAKGYRVIRGG